MEEGTLDSDRGEEGGDSSSEGSMGEEAGEREVGQPAEVGDEAGELEEEGEDRDDEDELEEDEEDEDDEDEVFRPVSAVPDVDHETRSDGGRSSDEDQDLDIPSFLR